MRRSMAPTQSDRLDSQLESWPRQRGSSRLVLDPDEASVEGLSVANVAVIDLSASGIGLAMPRGLEFDRGELTALLRVGKDRTEVRLAPVRIDDVGSALRMGACFGELSPEALAVLGRFLIDGFLRRQRLAERSRRAAGGRLRFRAPAFIGELLREKTIRQHAPLSVHRKDGSLIARLLARRNQAGALALHIETTTGGAPHGLQHGQAYDFSIADSAGVTRFVSRVACLSQDTVLIEAPAELEQSGFREHIRQRIPEGDGRSVDIWHARVCGGVTRQQLRDVSASGLSFVAAPEAGLILPGDPLPRLLVDLPSGPVDAVARVRRVTPVTERKALEYGIEMTGFLSDDDRRRWERYVHESVHPRVRVGEPGIERSAWSLLASSGYIELWTSPEDRQRLAHSFQYSWRSAAPETGRLLVFSENARDYGTFATNRLYPRAWLLHGLGVDKVVARRVRQFIEVARELYRALMSILKCAPGARYFVGYFEREQHWGDLLYRNFVEAYSNRRASLYDEYRLSKWRDDGRVATPEPADGQVEVAPASTADWQALSDRLRATVSPLEFDAFSYAPEEIDLAKFSRFCAEQGYERRRDVFVAREAGAVAAMLIAECGAEGASIFGLLDSCRIVWWPWCANQAAVKGRLLRAAAAHYRRMHRREAIFLDTDDLIVPESSGFRAVADGLRWVANLELLSAWRSYLDQVLSLRTRRRNEPPREGAEVPVMEV
jgi:hypothetical protein